MKTTLNFDDRLIREAKARAAQDGDTLTRLIERALRDYLRPVRDFRARLLTKRGSALAGVDLDDPGLLYERMGGRDYTNAQIVAVCRESGVSHLITEDRDFNRFKGLSVAGIEER